MAWMAKAVEVSGGVGRVAILLSVAALVGSAVAILFGYLRPGLVYVTAGMVVGAQLAFAWATPESSGLPGTWWAWQLMIPVCVLICAAQPLPAAVPARAVALAAYTVLRLSPASGPEHGIRATVSDLSCSCLYAVVALVTVPASRRTAEVSDATNRARLGAVSARRGAGAGHRRRLRIRHRPGQIRKAGLPLLDPGADR